MDQRIEVKIDGTTYTLKHDIGAIARYCQDAEIKTWEDYFAHVADPIKFVSVCYQLGNRKENKEWDMDKAESLPFDVFMDVMGMVAESSGKVKSLLGKVPKEAKKK